LDDRLLLLIFILGLVRLILDLFKHLNRRHFIFRLVSFLRVLDPTRSDCDWNARPLIDVDWNCGDLS
jgi:hypothetical protein